MSARSPFSIDGNLADLGARERSSLLDRAFEVDSALADRVSGIIAAIATDGDRALRAMAQRFDGVRLDKIEVPREAWRAARARTPAPLVAALERARDRIVAFHRRQRPVADEVELGSGIRLGRRPEALRTVGAYAPGGRAAYPSSVLMCVLPARVAGVRDVLVCSPPGASGSPADVVLAACDVAGADRLFAIGGAGAVAALAYGTESVPRADKVVGPGNAYVVEAKRQLAGRIGSDCLAGPSELLIVADGTAQPEAVARELIAQAEHDPDAVVVAVVSEASLAKSVRSAVTRLCAAQPRREIIEQAMRCKGALLVAGVDEALSFASAFAPEHLLLLVEAPREAMSRVRGAGAVFLGPASSVAFGDYMSGTNHVLPTAGQGRNQSGLCVADFVRWSTYQEIDRRGAAELAAATECLATAEGLAGHAAAAAAWSPDRDTRGVMPGETSGVAPGDRAAAAKTQSVRVRPDYEALEIYDPGRDRVEIDLSDNTNLFGQAPSAVRALEQLRAADLRAYPSPYGRDLKEAAAGYFGVSASCVATGCGSDDLIDSTIRAFCVPGDSVAYPRPSFSMIEAFARMNGVRPIEIELAPGFELDADALAAAGAQVTYLCRPNNPTGNAFRRAAVERLVARATGVVVIDEAYGDFCDDPLVAWAPETPNVVVLRTMSKVFGLAGLRVGIAVGAPELIVEIEKSRGPYKVGVAAEIAAAAALRNDADWVVATVAESVQGRRRLATKLARLGLRSYPSSANFLLVQAAGGSATEFARHLAEGGIGVRAFPGLPEAGECVRVTVGPAPMMERFLERTREVLGR